MQAFDVRKLCGWKQDTVGIQQTAREVGSIRQVARGLIGGERKDAYLFLPLLACKPNWRRGAQGLGDCGSWGTELAATLLMAVDGVAGTGSWIEEAATEPIYGGGRVEVLGKSRGGRSDGMMGYAAAKWLKEFGVLLRTDYSKETGNREHDLRKYDAKKAKEWGDYGCGGSADKGKLDAVARLHPVEHIAQVKTVEEAIAALSNYYPVTIASMAGFGDMKRDSNGLCKWVNQWAHLMCLIALRWRNGKPEFRVGQSWGDSCSGPDPGIEELLPKTVGNDGASLYLPSSATNRADFIRRLILPDEAFPYHVESAADWNAISACSWWIDERTLARILQTGDCWSIAGVKGFEPRKLNVKKAVYDRLGLAV
jgi:hypothetical protein